MAKKILNVLTQGHRATIEEQDDPVLWLDAVLAGSGSDISILLRGAAIGSAVKGQDASGLTFGDRGQTKPPRLQEDVARLVSKGVSVRYLAEDAAERGFQPTHLVDGVEPLARGELPAYLRGFDQVWGW